MTSTTITAMIPPSRLVLLLDVSRVPIADRVGDAEVSVTDDAAEDAVDTEHTILGEANCIIQCYNHIFYMNTQSYCTVFYSLLYILS